MTTLLAIDPGVNTGWALFESGHLLSCGLNTYFPYQHTYFPYQPEILVIEKPQIYPRQKGDPNDLIDLAVVVGRYIERVDALTDVLVKPHEWKSSVPKTIHNRRVLAALTAEELKIFRGAKVAKSKAHNVVDAIGLGLWQLGRSL